MLGSLSGPPTPSHHFDPKGENGIVFLSFIPSPPQTFNPVEQQTTSYLHGMLKTCFPFDTKEPSHQLSKHWAGRRARVRLQSPADHRARVVSKGTSGFGRNSRKGVIALCMCQSARCNGTQGLQETAAVSLHTAAPGVPLLLSTRTQAQVKYHVLGSSTPATTGRLLNSVSHRASPESSALRNAEPKAEGQACPGGSHGQMLPEFLGTGQSRPELANRKGGPGTSGDRFQST